MVSGPNKGLKIIHFLFYHFITTYVLLRRMEIEIFRALKLCN